MNFINYLMHIDVSKLNYIKFFIDTQSWSIGKTYVYDVKGCK
jgi:hypothetical protein